MLRHPRQEPCRPAGGEAATHGEGQGWPHPPFLCGRKQASEVGQLCSIFIACEVLVIQGSLFLLSYSYTAAVVHNYLAAMWATRVIKPQN